MKCPVQFLLVYVSLVAMTAGFVLTLSAWFAPPINKTVLQVRQVGPCVFFGGCSLLLVACVVYAFQQGLCAALCYVCCPKILFADTENDVIDAVSNASDAQQSATAKQSQSQQAKATAKNSVKSASVRSKHVKTVKLKSTNSRQENFSPRKSKFNSVSKVKYKALDPSDKPHKQINDAKDTCFGRIGTNTSKLRYIDDGCTSGDDNTARPTSLLCLPSTKSNYMHREGSDPQLTTTCLSTQLSDSKPPVTSSTVDGQAKYDMLNCFSKKSFGVNTISLDCLPLRMTRDESSISGRMLLPPSDYSLMSPDGAKSVSSPDCFVLNGSGSSDHDVETGLYGSCNESCVEVSKESDQPLHDVYVGTDRQ